MINTTLFLFAIPLNLIGYLLKQGKKVHNKLIPVIVTIISFIFCFTVGKILGNQTVDAVVKFGIGKGLMVAGASAYGWDIVHGIKTVIKDVTAQAEKLINFDKEENMDRLKRWHKALFSNLLAIVIVSLGTFIVGYANTKMGTNTIAASIDMTVLAMIFVSSGSLVLDLIKRIVKKDKGLNTQYGICFGLAALAIVAFIMGYIAVTWTITFISFGAFVVLSALSLFCVRYSYLPSLRPKEVVIKEMMERKWAEYNNMTDEEVLIHMKKDIKYLFKKQIWGAELNVDKPIFLDSEGNALSVEDIASLNSTEHKTVIDNAVKDFVTVIKTREVK